MKASVQLHQFAKVLTPDSSLPMLPHFSLAAPQPLCQHPTPHRGGRDLDLVFARQVLGRQRWPETLAHLARVLLADQTHHLRAYLLGLGPVGSPACIAMHHRRAAVFAIAFPQTLGLPVTELHLFG